MKKRLIILILISVACLSSRAQNTDIPLRVVLADEAAIPEPAARYLRDRLLFLTCGSATAVDEGGASQFFLTAKARVDSRDVVGSVPTVYSLDLSVTLYLADWVNDRLYSRIALQAKGIGQSEAKAWIDAIKRLKIDEPRIAAFLTEGRSKIIHYYDSEGETILQNARMLASQRQYEKALFLLAAIPSACEELHARAQGALVEIFKQFVDYAGQRDLTRARTIWAATQSRDGALEAAALLAGIDPDAACYPAAEQLAQQIEKQVGRICEMKVYDDAVDLKKQRIDAARQVGIAFGNNQQPHTTNLH